MTSKRHVTDHVTDLALENIEQRLLAAEIRVLVQLLLLLQVTRS